MLDFARMEHRDAWLRHPVLGDASFDTFEKLGETVHRSAPPFAWAVNGSIYRDFDGVWYCYAGLYAFGYAAVSEETAASTQEMTDNAAFIQSEMKKFNLRQREKGKPYIPEEKRDDPEFVRMAYANYQHALEEGQLEPAL